MVPGAIEYLELRASTTRRPDLIGRRITLQRLASSIDELLPIVTQM